MNAVANGLAIAVVCLATVLIAVRGLGSRHTTEDVFVAARSVKPWWNASAIGGEYLSAASFLGVVGLIALSGRDGLWYPVGYAAGFLMLLLFVAAPLRRSGAYTLPDFALVRFGDERAARALGYAVLGVGWLYVLPQMHGAAVTVTTVMGAPAWVGPLVVTAVVIASVVPGGMRSITLVQAVQYWIKLAALAIPTIAVALVLGGGPFEAGTHAAGAPLPESTLSPLVTVSLLLALVFGTMGLPHVLVRFYTNPDGESARRTTVMVTGLVSLFYLFPTTLGLLAVASGQAAGAGDATVLLLPGSVVGGIWGVLLTALITGGAFAAFVSTSSGLCIAMAGVMSRRFFSGSVSGFRRGALIAALVPGLLSLVTASSAIAGVIGSVFALTASTIAPVLLAGIWWRAANGAGAVAGLVTGATVWLAGTAATLLGAGGMLGGLAAQPALLSVPAACLAIILVSLARPDRGPDGALDAVMRRLHTP
ncbi:sodium/solute symporter [Galactobacter caseinivorans]|uniref:Cation acetate symporter n=1 Tax=Galactobacter caseinivorans TaxID=2676123 RepID=A0A496PJQ9_9MICC|nr:cation acetate symporter [Galactobacter caseinivorans]RKW70744.1 cation acetate symporter [Galactobacter caseinivorans]